MVNIMIIGCGAIAPAHIEGLLKQSKEANIKVLANTTISKAEKLNEKYNLNAIVTSNYKEYLNTVDAVVILTPPSLHEEIAIEAFESGCHVLVEKPLAPSLQSCDRIIEASIKNQKLLSVVVQSRFISGIKNVVDIVKSQKYGKLLYTRVNSVWYRGESYYDLKWRGRWEVEGGGCTLNHSIHQIDLLLWVKGMPKSIRSFATNLNHNNSEEEDFSSSILEYEDGSVAEITSSLISHGEPQKLHFQMTQAGIEIPFKAYASKARENGFPMDDMEKVKEIEEHYQNLEKLAFENHDGQVANFIDAILGKSSLLTTGIEGRRCIELITGIYKSSFTGEKVHFPISNDDKYYSDEWRKTAYHFNEKTKDISSFEDTTITNFKDKF